MTCTAPILALWRAIWQAHTTLRDILLMPAEKVPSEDDTVVAEPAADPPYATLRVLPGDKGAINSGSAFIQSYKVELKLYVPEATQDLQAIADLAENAYNAIVAANVTTFKCLLILPSNDDWQVADEEYMGRVLQTATLRWMVIAQQTR